MPGNDPNYPSGVSLVGREALQVRWADGHESTLPLALLRRNCPCAKCRTLRSRVSLQVLTTPAPDRLEVLEVAPVGFYALRIRWSDEHSAGLYPYTLLRSLCPCAGCRSGDGGQAPSGCTRGEPGAPTLSRL